MCIRDSYSAVLGLACGTLAMTLMMIPLNLIFTVYFLGASRDLVISMLIPIIIPVSYTHLDVYKRQIGGHRLHLRTLDIETISVAGGSMLRASRDGAVEVGPRSAHIAGLPYYCFDPEAQPSEAEWIAPLPGDPAEYIVLRSGDARWAFTVTCAQRTLDGHLSLIHI